ncbi:PHP domain-containing protein [Candidatus Bathyarchaeota archaeon]|nr:MAG: PHP domain-containing protein [Candidatus Bathyarchaeota archaeon]
MTEPLDLPDLHIQTAFTDGDSPVESFIEEAKRKGIKTLGISDHYSLWHKICTPEKFLRYLNELNRYPVYAGVEMDVGYELPLYPNIRERLDYIMVGLHRLDGKWLFSPYSFRSEDPRRVVERMKTAMIQTMENVRPDVLAHPTQLPLSLRPKAEELITREWSEDLISAAANLNVAIEINCGARLPNEEFIKICLRKGVKVTFGSSAHTPSRVGELEYGWRMVRKLGITQEQIFRPKKSRKAAKYRVMIKAELKGRQLDLKVPICDDVSPEDLELAIFYQRRGEVDRRIIIPSRNYSNVLCNSITLDYAPSELEIRLYERGSIIDQMILTQSIENL